MTVYLLFVSYEVNLKKKTEPSYQLLVNVCIKHCAFVLLQVWNAEEFMTLSMFWKVLRWSVGWPKTNILGMEKLIYTIHFQSSR